jgi:thiamine-phosphate pyrophosphorylase
LFPPLYAILDVEQASGNAPALPSILARAGVQLIQLRDKRASAARMYEVAQKLVESLAAAGVRIIINDRPDIAVMVGASGTHVGQEDLPVEDARRICASPRWVGVSTHNLEQFRHATLTSADYIAVGPIFPTTTKENPDRVVGLEFLRAARKLTKKPLVAIGGITVESAGAVFQAGADSIAVIQDLLSAADPAERAKEFLAIAARARRAQKLN